MKEKKDQIRVCGILRDEGACGMYRISQPMKMLNDRFDVDAAIGGVNCHESDLDGLLESCEIAIVPRPVSDKMFNLIDILHKMGKKVVADHDDNIFHINPMSPHYGQSGTEEVDVEVDGEIIKVWEDGDSKGGSKKFDIAENKKKLETAEKCLREVDAITVTTEELKKFYLQYNDNVYVLPNCLNLDIWKPVKMEKDGRLRITWHGGCSHYMDLLSIKDSLTHIAGKYDHVKYVICGHEFKGIFKDVREDQYEFHYWVPTIAHPYKQALLNADIAVIPLKDDLFNRCKSAIKWVEYSSLKIPSVVVNIPPYSPEVEHGKTGLLYNNNEEFEEHLEMLINYPMARADIGASARNYIEDKFDARNQAELWADVYKKVMEG